MIGNILILIAGFIFLIKGADLFVDGSSSTAMHLKISKIIIGLTIIAFGTSAPEFAVSLKSISLENHNIVIGNVLGSNILNILLIIGCSSLVHYLNVKDSTIKKELPFLLGITTILSILLLDSVFFKSTLNNFTRLDGTIVFLIFLIFIAYIIKTTIKDKKSEINKFEKPKYKISISILFIAIGIIMIVFGSNFVVESATFIAKELGVSDKLIALTVIALGTSLPELVTSVMATKKGEYDLAIGNVVGSNIFNIGLVLGFPVMVFGGSNNIDFNYIDVVVMLLSVVLFYIFSLKDKKIKRWEGCIFLLFFIIYYGYVIISG